MSVQWCYAGFGSGRCHGYTIIFKDPGSFEPVNDMIGGGPFDLDREMWSDDTVYPFLAQKTMNLLQKIKFNKV